MDVERRQRGRQEVVVLRAHTLDVQVQNVLQYPKLPRDPNSHFFAAQTCAVKNHFTLHQKLPRVEEIPRLLDPLQVPIVRVL